MSLTIENIREAAAQLAPHFGPTPLLASPGLSAQFGKEIFLKAENLQRTGTFKIRGAYNRISRLGGPEECPGVICASAGNHAQGVGLAARMTGLTATIVMPVTTPIIKVARTRALGAHVLLWGESYEEAYQRALDIGRERGYVFVHAFEDLHVIAGQGTIGLEILEQAESLDAVVVPVGGGGLIAGIAMAVKEINPGIAVYGVQAAGAAPVVESIKSGKPVTLERAETIADAIRFRGTSEVTFPLITRYVDEVVTVSEQDISQAVVSLLEETKLVVEGAGAVPLAAVIAGKLPEKMAKTALILSGGNMDLNLIARVLEQGLSRANRYLVVRVRVSDTPGRLHRLLSHFVSKRINVLDVIHHRAGWCIPLGQVEIELLLETRDREHVMELLGDLKDAGYSVECDENPEKPDRESPAEEDGEESEVKKS
jgi:threonine dehydratase